MKVTIIGAGNMGRAMAKALVKDSRWSVTMVDRPGADIETIKGVAFTTDLLLACKGSGIVLMAVKPQDAKEALENLRSIVVAQTIVVSIMAGVPMRALRRLSGHTRLVRAMPNTPAQIGLGMTVWCPARSLTPKEWKTLSLLFGAFGQETRVANEHLIDAATAVSGSGPAYVFALAEYLAGSAEQLGFSKETAGLLAKQTILGAATLLSSSSDSPATLRERVTSKKGTTEAALKVFQKRKTAAIYQSAIQAAATRATELSKLWD